MKRLAVLGFTIATLFAPIQVQAQTTCVTFPPNSNPEAEVRYLISHPGARVCPGPNTNPGGLTTTLGNGMTRSANDTLRLMCSMSGRVC